MGCALNPMDWSPYKREEIGAQTHRYKNTCSGLHLGLPAYGTAREYISVVEATPFVLLCDISLSKLRHHLCITYLHAHTHTHTLEIHAYTHSDPTNTSCVL